MRIYIKTCFRRKMRNKPNKTREEMRRVMDIHMKMQTSSLRCTVSQFIITKGATLCGENKRNKEMLVKGQTESSTMYCVCRLWTNVETGLWDCWSKLEFTTDLFSRLTKVWKDTNESGKWESTTSWQDSEETAKKLLTGNQITEQINGKTKTCAYSFK